MRQLLFLGLVALLACGEEEKETTETPKKPRGRPKKIVEPVPTEAPPEEPAVKKRGRPKKVISEPQADPQAEEKE